MTNEITTGRRPAAMRRTTDLAIATSRQFAPTEPIGVLTLVAAAVAAYMGFQGLIPFIITLTVMIPTLLAGAAVTEMVERSVKQQEMLSERARENDRHRTNLVENVGDLLIKEDKAKIRIRATTPPLADMFDPLLLERQRLEAMQKQGKVAKTPETPTATGSMTAFISQIAVGDEHDRLLQDVATQIGTLHDRWKDVRRKLDIRISADEIRQIDVEADAAVRKLIQDAMQRHQIQQDERRRDMRRLGPDIVSGFAAEARAIAGTANAMPTLPPPSTTAALGRLTAIAERALEQDPDLVDGTGARIDTLVRQHLPRLAQRHADAAKGSGDLHEVDAMLDAGVEEARASVEEALGRDRARRFDALRDEVAFLRARRGDSTV